MITGDARTTLEALATEATKRLQDPSGFRDWLRRFRSSEKVGDRFSGDSCPIANYLHTDPNAERLRVSTQFLTNRAIFIDGDILHLADLPTWAVRFISAFDVIGSRDSAGACLELLERVLAEA
jgi:hypothetical protein